MAKLYFRYGTVDAAKTMNLLAVAYNYRKQGKRVFTIAVTHKIAAGFDDCMLSSRSGLQEQADLLLESSDGNYPIFAAMNIASGQRFKPFDCILVDEAQFLPVQIVDKLRMLTLDPGIPVICYGLRTDSNTELFAGSRRLMEVADSIEEIKVTCTFCNKKAIYSLRHDESDKPTKCKEPANAPKHAYKPCCAACYYKKFDISQQDMQES